MNIAELIRYWARWRPDHPAVIHNDREMTWGEYDRRSDALARGLRKAGIGKGGRVGMLMGNRIEAPLLVAACVKLGAIFVPLNFKLTAIELLSLLEDAECRIVVTEAHLLPQLELAASQLGFDVYATDTSDVRSFGQLEIDEAGEPYEAIGLLDPAFICYTSGTTGRQKGALLTHGSALYPGLAKNLAEGLTWRDRTLVAVPFVFTGAVISCFIQIAVTAGATMVLESDFNVDRYLDVIQRHKVTAMTTVPVIWERLLRSPEIDSADLSHVISAAAGGAPVSLSLIEAYRARGVALIQSYGLTEASGLVATMHSEDAMRHIGWAGRAIAGTKIRIGDEQGNTLPFGETGEIMVRGPHVMREYWRKLDVTAETIVDGWLRTGDVGMMNEAGFLKLVDRSKDMLISGGINVYPAEIEKALAGVEGISELAVIGVPDSEWGEVPMVVAHGSGNPDAVIQALEQAGGETLAKFKRPRHIVFTDEPLPRTLSGKISKPNLRGLYPTAEGAAPLFSKNDTQ
jgi:acyl-CoA synthetase (AMP-forming)/AMP-acid ligase II